ncbi:MAG: hypothetical protein ACPF9S_04270 [Candidatus Poseidoniaceae archaeon]
MVSIGAKILLSLSSIALGIIMFLGAIRSSGFLGTPNGGAIFGSFCFILIGLVSLGIMMFNGIMSSKLVQQNQIISRGKANSPRLSDQEMKTGMFGLALFVFGSFIYGGDGFFDPAKFADNLVDVGFIFSLIGLTISVLTFSKLLGNSNEPEGKQ